MAIRRHVPRANRCLAGGRRGRDVGCTCVGKCGWCKAATLVWVVVRGTGGLLGLAWLGACVAVWASNLSFLGFLAAGAGNAAACCLPRKLWGFAIWLPFSLSGGGGGGGGARLVVVAWSLGASATIASPDRPLPAPARLFCPLLSPPAGLPPWHVVVASEAPNRGRAAPHSLWSFWAGMACAIAASGEGNMFPKEAGLGMIPAAHRQRQRQRV